jgi:hypothetical protein
MRNIGLARTNVLKEGNRDEAMANGVCGFSEKGGGGSLGTRRRREDGRIRMMTKVRKLPMDIKKAGPTLDG